VKIQIITQARGRSGRVMQQKRVVEGDWIRVGRSASSELHLPDPRVALNQGLFMDRGGLVYSEGETGIVNPGSTTRKAVKSIRMAPGTSIDVGPYKFTSIEPPAGFDGAITIEMVRPLEEAGGGGDLRSRATHLTLASLKVPKRWAAWLLLLIVAVVFFFIPAGRVLDLPWHQASEKDMIAGDKFWNPGPVILAHQPIGMKCAACHEVAFEHVKDRACLECHRNIGHHVPQDMLQKVAGKPGEGLFEGQRCTSCHVDHKGIKSTHRDNDTFCVDCHKDVRGKSSGAMAQNVTDFTKAHPAFRLTFPSEAGPKRVRMGAAPIKEQSNLVFPHDIHLDKKGVKSPTRGRVVLECAACHAPDASKRTFEPVSMKRNCQECHQLQFEPAVTTREVPHGNARDAKVVVEEFYANLALNGVKDSFVKAFGIESEGLLRRVGEPSEAERKVALNMAGAKAEKVAHELFEVRACKTCHEVTREEKDGAVDWKVAKIRANNVWMPSARFDHKSHAQSACSDCHKVSTSKASSDVAMPTIEDCRKCHGGSKPVEKLITSNCLMCHGFHEAKHPWDPTFKPRGTTKVAERTASGG
jgi:predicted CXXCH cytochrome family protein